MNGLVKVRVVCNYKKNAQINGAVYEKYTSLSVKVAMIRLKIHIAQISRAFCERYRMFLSIIYGQKEDNKNEYKHKSLFKYNSA